MVWKKKKNIKLGLTKKTIVNFNKEKKVSRKYFFLWERRCIWESEELSNFLNKFVRKFIKLKVKLNFFILKKYRSILNKPVYSRFYKNDPLNTFFFKYPTFILKHLFFDEFLKKWIFSLLKLLTKHGKKHKAFILVIYLIININKKFKNLSNFFKIIHQRMKMSLKLRLRVVAGRKVYIPVLIGNRKQIMFILRMIASCLKNRSELKLKDRLLNELIDIYSNKPACFSLKRRLQFIKEIHDCIPNTRFLRF